MNKFLFGLVAFLIAAVAYAVIFIMLTLPGGCAAGLSIFLFLLYATPVAGFVALGMGGSLGVVGARWINEFYRGEPAWFRAPAAAVGFVVMFLLGGSSPFLVMYGSGALAEKITPSAFHSKDCRTH